MRVLLISSPVAPLGEGATGGLSLHIESTVKALSERGHEVHILAPKGSQLPGATIITCDGAMQPTQAHPQGEDTYPILRGSVLVSLWHEARAQQQNYDLLINMAHDWLPYFLTAFFEPPLLHIVNLGNVEKTTGDEIIRAQKNFPSRIAFLSSTQAAQFEGIENPFLLSLGIDLTPYQFNENPEGGLVWAGRISPEKGIEDALSLAREEKTQLIIAGAIDNEPYWAKLQSQFGDTIDYRGFLGRDALQHLLGKAKALLQTQKWQEAFGLVTIEAMACGTPVIAYTRGANQELIKDNVTGYLVLPDDQKALASALGQIEKLDRRACRAHVEEHYSLSAYGARLEDWLERSLLDR